MSWILHSQRGQQVWKYHADQPAFPEIPYDRKKNPNSADRVYRTRALLNYQPANPALYTAPSYPTFAHGTLADRAARANIDALNHYQYLQMDDGHWPGDYGGPMFLMPGAIITLYVTKTPIAPEKRQQMIKYIFNHQQESGGWGLHIEADSTMFGTVLNYVALRILGIPPSDPRMAAPRAFIQRNGGAHHAPSWCKFWLCVLGTMEWDGYNSVFPELWLMPESLPLHPWRWWCHCRMVYLPMAYIFAEKVTGEITDLVRELRTELYTEPYENVQWHKYRDSVAPIDLYFPQTPYVKVLNFIANTYERVHSSFLRKRAAKFMLDYIHAEDDQTRHVDIGPVNKFVNMLSVWHGDGPDSDRFRLHMTRVDDYFWVAEDGMKMQGYNGSQLWDTAFAAQAIAESGLGAVFPRTLSRAYDYIEVSQVKEEVPMRVEFYRHISKSGWPFSTIDHGWPITDCTSEGMKATLAIHLEERALGVSLAPGARITDERLREALDVLLSFQNEDGGWATYENKRAGGWMEYINPAEVFSGIMVDYSYTECTSASMQALVAYSKQYPTYRAHEIRQCLDRGVAFLKSQQRADGSWYGSWAVCFTYGAWFAMEGLMAAGESAECEAVRRGCDFLLSIQKSDGGWGESYLSCVRKKYVAHEHSQVVNTAWACLALLIAAAKLDAKSERRAAIVAAVKRGIVLLLQRQKSNGDWDQEAISGVFNGNCMITYTNYRNIFPMWAIGRYVQWCRANPTDAE